MRQPRYKEVKDLDPNTTHRYERSALKLADLPKEQSYYKAAFILHYFDERLTRYGGGYKNINFQKTRRGVPNVFFQCSCSNPQTEQVIHTDLTLVWFAGSRERTWRGFKLKFQIPYWAPGASVKAGVRSLNFSVMPPDGVLRPYEPGDIDPRIAIINSVSEVLEFLSTFNIWDYQERTKL